VLERDAPAVRAIDLLNDAPAFNVEAAAHLLAALVPTCPQDSVFLAVVDPGVGSHRLPVVLSADGYHFVGPDNGLLSVIAARAARTEAYRIAWAPERLAPSFHGRDLFAPVAARLATGTLPEGGLERLPSGLEVNLGSGDLSRIIYVDHYGNAMSGLRAGTLARDTRLTVKNTQLRRARVFSEVPEGEAFWYENSLGLAEIAMNRGSAARALGLHIGDPLAVDA
jgi:S-adenosyl-L-methionine hydrolase (adenosine-forming)